MRVLITSAVALSCLAAPAAHAGKAIVLHDFNQHTQIAGGIIAGPDGTLYGELSFGGGQGCKNGCIYALAPPAAGATAWTYTVLHSFASNPGFGGVTRGPDGTLYGTSMDAAGISSIFSLAPPATGQTAWTYTTLVTLPSNIQANSASASLILTGDTITAIAEGGATNCPYSGCGALLRITKGATGAWSLTALYAFNGDRLGGTPVGLVGPDAAGAFYVANADGNRVIYATPGTGGFAASLVATFGANTPYCLVLSASAVYGVAAKVVGPGNIFQITPSQAGGWTTTTLLRHGTGGFSPCPEIAGPGGSLLGLTGANADTYDGSAFQITPPAAQGSWTYKTLFQFGQVNRTDSTNIIFGYQGDLYAAAERAYGPPSAILRIPYPHAPQSTR